MTESNKTLSTDTKSHSDFEAADEEEIFFDPTPTRIHDDEMPVSPELAVIPIGEQRLAKRNPEPKSLSTVALSLVVIINIALFGLAYLSIASNVTNNAQLIVMPSDEIGNTTTRVTPSLTIAVPETSTSSPTPGATHTPIPTEIDPLSIPAGGAGTVVTLDGVSLVFVPGGTFQMGDQRDPTARFAHDIELDPYFIDRFEVTNLDWEQCVAAGYCKPPASALDYLGNKYYGEHDYENHPVTFVNWSSAEVFCKWRKGRLPTEAEWEMAARWDPKSGETTLYPWGDKFQDNQANGCDASCPLSTVHAGFDDGWAQTSPVGFFRSGASPLGVTDMIGNVAEWVADWYQSDYYTTSSSSNPPGPKTGTRRVVRGGAWGTDLKNIYATTRSSFLPDAISAGLGFRCVMDVRAEP